MDTEKDLAEYIASHRTGYGMESKVIRALESALAEEKAKREASEAREVELGDALQRRRGEVATLRARVEELTVERNNARITLQNTEDLFKHPGASIRLGHGETCACWGCMMRRALDAAEARVKEVTEAWEASKKDREFHYSGRIEAMIRAEKAEAKLSALLAPVSDEEEREALRGGHYENPSSAHTKDDCLYEVCDCFSRKFEVVTRALRQSRAKLVEIGTALDPAYSGGDVVWLAKNYVKNVADIMAKLAAVEKESETIKAWAQAQHDADGEVISNLSQALERARGALEAIRAYAPDDFDDDTAWMKVWGVPASLPPVAPNSCHCHRSEENGHYDPNCPHYKGICVSHNKSNCGPCDFDNEAKWNKVAPQEGN